jgi:hypothetical protein
VMGPGAEVAAEEGGRPGGSVEWGVRWRHKNRRGLL